MICPLLQKDFLIWYYTYYFAYSDNCPLRKFARPIRVGVWGQGQGQFQGGWGNQRIVPEENCPLVNFGVGNNFPPGQLSQNVILLLLKILLKRSVAVVVQLVVAVVVGAVVVTVVVQLQCSGSRDKTSFSLTSFWWKLKYHKN